MKYSLALPLMLAIVGCSSTPDTMEWGVSDEMDSALELPADQAAPPPLPTTLSVPTGVAGGPLTLTATGFPAGTSVTFIASTNTTAPGVCPAAIAPTCLAVPAGFVTLGARTADATGRATLTVTVPNPAPSRLEFQAYGARAGTYYLSNGVIINVLTATGDQDNDGLNNLSEAQRGTNPTVADTDGDGVRDGAEVTAGTNPLVADTDGDGLSDGAEATAGTNPQLTDTDGDGVPDGPEVNTFGTNPLAADSDSDGLSDGQELSNGINPLDADSDDDGLTDGAEVANGLNPLDPDSDDDGLTDGAEVAGGTNPLSTDSDGDGLTDGAEVAGGTNPLDSDSDDDGVSDRDELVYGTNPLDLDTDDDGLSDGQELSIGTSPISADTDADLLGDGIELLGGTNPLSGDTDGDGVGDGAEDSNYNGAVDSGETSPIDADSDDDGVSDGAEYAVGTDPLIFDTDGDGLSDDEGAVYGTDPLNPDTDGGTANDGLEVSRGSDPLNPADDIPRVCGDGAIQPGEDCDDGNTLNGDSCPSNCLYVREIEPNDAFGVANGPFLAPVSVYSSINPAGDVDWYALTVPAWADLRIETFDSAGVTCAVDTLAALYRADGTTLVASDDDDGTNLCSLIQPSTDTGVRHIAPGTYLLQTKLFSNTTTAPTVRTTITFDALCGDGVRAGSEECDGGALCDVECQRVPVCGDGLIDGAETCDDGNLNSFDGCSSSCLIEGVVNEIEPNDTTANADANTSILISSPTVIAGAASPATDKDFFKVNVTGPQVITFETFENAAANDVTSTTFTTSMFLFDAAGVSQSADTGIATNGIRSASALSWPFSTAGSFYIQVEEAGRNAVLPGYRLAVEYPPAFGPEVEPNDLQATAQPLVGSSGWVAGDHQIAADLDWYSITVPANSSLRLEVIEGDRAVETCESNGLDSYLTLFSAAGASLAVDDDSSRGFCSLIDGTGSAAQLDTGANRLAAGTYFIQVKAFSTTAGGQFNYKLVWKIRTP